MTVYEDLDKKQLVAMCYEKDNRITELEREISDLEEGY